MQKNIRELIVRDPYSGAEIERVSEATSETLANALTQAKNAFQKWRHSTAWSRSQLLTSAAVKLSARKEEFANLIRQEAGKPILLARIEVDRAIGVLHWAAAETQRYGGEILRLDTTASGRSGFGIHTRFPRGPVLGITPFNFPLNLAIHKIAPAIASGCSIIIKPSPFTPLITLRCAELFSDEPGLVQVLIANDEQTIELTQAPEIKTISFTGSARVGWLIRQQAPHRPTLLELGGNAWVVVCEDTPREKFSAIAQRICKAAYGYAGQSCISVQNVAVAAPIYDEFQAMLSDLTRNTSYGNPELESVISGPVIHLQAAQRIRRSLEGTPPDFQQIHSTRFEDGGRSHCLKEALISPTLVVIPAFNRTSNFQSVLPEIVREEIFAPVMTLTSFKNMEDIVSLVNAGPYGLQSGVYTPSWTKIEYLYQHLEVGGLVVNDVPTTRYDHQPYGGVRESGLGREGIRYAMDEMTESKFLALSSEIPLG